MIPRIMATTYSVNEDLHFLSAQQHLINVLDHDALHVGDFLVRFTDLVLRRIVVLLLEHEKIARARVIQMQHRKKNHSWTSPHADFTNTNHQVLERGRKVSVHAISIGLFHSVTKSLLESLNSFCEKCKRDTALGIPVRHAQILELVLADQVKHVPCHDVKTFFETDHAKENSRHLDTTSAAQSPQAWVPRKNSLIIDEGRFPIRFGKFREQLVGDRCEVASNLAARFIQGFLNQNDGSTRDNTVDDIALSGWGA